MTNMQATESTINQAIASGKLVGTVVMVAKDGETIYARNAGMADREAQKSVELATVFRAASLTKPIVAATILAMADRGLVRIDEPVRSYLPLFRPRMADGIEPVITLHHLLTHTAGLTYDYSRDPRISGGLTNSDMPLEEVLRLIAEQPLAYEPGASWQYSVAVDVLGGVVAAVHGGQLSDAVAHYVTGPLAMRDTVFSLSDSSRLATPYADGEDEPVRMSDPHAAKNPWGGVTTFSPSRIFNSRAFQSGGAGMATTAPDFLRFLEAMLHGGSPVLAPATAADALRNQMVYEREPGQAFSFLGSYTVDPEKAGHPWAAGTNNWGGIYGHIWSIDPTNRISMVSLSNTAFYGGELDYPRALRRAVYTDLV